MMMIKMATVMGTAMATTMMRMTTMTMMTTMMIRTATGMTMT